MKTIRFHHPDAADISAVEAQLLADTEGEDVEVVQVERDGATRQHKVCKPKPKLETKNKKAKK